MLVLAPECVDAFVAAALATQADIITGMPSHPGDDRLAHAQPNGFLSYFPLGACAEIGAFENCFGKGAFLVSRRGFDRLGGFRPPYDRAIQDWLFLAASVLSGLHLEVVPEPLFRYKTMRPADLQRANPVDSHRRILAAYSGQQMQLFTHIIEGLLSIDRANQERLQQLLGEFGNDAGEIALRVSTSLEPNQPEALRGLVQFCLERRRIDEAVDFALHNGRSVLSDAVDSAKLMAENLALDAIRRETPDLLHDVALTDDVKARVQSVSSLPAKELVQPHDGVAQSIQAGITILKAAAICPPGTKSVHAAASVEAPDPRSVFVALVASSGDARLRISEENVISDQAFWWSGWVSAEQPQAGLELSVKVSEPVDQLLDLHFLCKTIEDGSPEGKVIWTSVTAAISANETISASAIETEVVTPIPRHVVDEGALLTQHPDFPFPVFVPGHPTLLHPLPGRAALVRFAQAVPRGAHGIRSVVSIERAEAHPVQFAAWIRSSSAPVAREADFTQADAFSGWVTVRDKLRRRRFTVSLPEPASEPMDLYLATRVVEYPDVHFCHAVWHDLLILE
jgi:hypothetical protein